MPIRILRETVYIGELFLKTKICHRLTISGERFKRLNKAYLFDDNQDSTTILMLYS